MQSKLVLVSGLSGAGKTTLIKGALESIPSLAYLKTYTTRPKRATEADSFEYVFVTDEEYATHRIQSKLWDHTLYNEYSYGADVEYSKALLAKGTNIICSVAPDGQALEEMAALYGIPPITIWVDTARETALDRVRNDEIRANRTEDENIKQVFQYRFTPVGNISDDNAAFVAMLGKLLS